MTESLPMHISGLNEQPWGAYLILASEGDAWKLPIGLRPVIATEVKAQLAGRGDSGVPALLGRVLGFVQGRLVRVEIAEDGHFGFIKCGAVFEHEGTERVLPLRTHDGALLARRAGVVLTATLDALRRAGIGSQNPDLELPARLSLPAFPVHRRAGCRGDDLLPRS